MRAAVHEKAAVPGGPEHVVPPTLPPTAPTTRRGTPRVVCVAEFLLRLLK